MVEAHIELIQFADEVVGGIPVSLFSFENGLVGIDSRICNCVPVAELAEVFESANQVFHYLYRSGATANQENSNALDEVEAETHELANAFLSLPQDRFNIFPFIDPEMSVVNCAGYRFIGSLGELDFDRHKLRSVGYALLDEDGPVKETVLVKDYMEYLDSLDISDYLRFGDPKQPKFGFGHFEGASVVIQKGALQTYLEREIPLSIDEIRRTIGAEKEAEINFRKYLNENPDARIHKKAARQRFFAEIGINAGIRVWNTVAQDHPSLKISGKKPFSSS